MKNSQSKKQELRLEKLKITTLDNLETIKGGKHMRACTFVWCCNDKTEVEK
ncbi:hypothetical protein [Aquimarina mytili]|uniref:Uncharacterized protein n=1 Tax=Aquimarina mytili TaxID=874423 RepID=A0A936ZVG5_9FLAO|nr:hypothetical protein [Aquimarina mytili]MBL0685057.1 hypothetical protein [Aquimarina mytili]